MATASPFPSYSASSQQGGQWYFRLERDIPVEILACWILGGAVLILAISWGIASPMSTITDELKAIPEVQKVYEQGYEIWFYRSPPNTRYQHWVLEARKLGRGKATPFRRFHNGQRVSLHRERVCRPAAREQRTGHGHVALRDAADAMSGAHHIRTDQPGGQVLREEPVALEPTRR